MLLYIYLCFIYLFISIPNPSLGTSYEYLELVLGMIQVAAA